MLDENSTPHSSPFDAIRHIDKNGNEYWSARELYKVLGYTEWRNFNSIVIKRAMKACEENGRVLSDHFVRSYNMMSTGKGARRKVEDYNLSRYAAYLVMMNSDPNMPVVAMGQEYFAIQTRRQELDDQLATLPENEDQKRLELRNEMKKLDTQLKIEVGSDVRETIKRQGGPLPEELSTPEKSIRQLERELQREERKRLERQFQPELPLLLDECKAY